jgi:DNA mismatch repair protein MutL
MDREAGPPRIVVLPADVVNQIAAGEVVERPAAVVKELVENALDAGARRVDVEVERGGLQRIRVVDDGCGMTAVEARLSLERHATSKLRVADDLCRVRTMGFRGEALPSIASVSRLTLTTRPAKADQGCELVVEGGAVRSEQPAAIRAGTAVEVRDLFYNTPARLKFLKSSATEAAHVTEAVSRLALGVPDVQLTLTHDGRSALELASCRDRLERSRLALGHRGERLLLATLADGDLAVEACLAPPDQTSRTAHSVVVLVNRRFVRDRAVLHAVTSGYGELLATGRFPTAVVYIDIEPSALDVNVHPQKVEVRFADPARVVGAVQRCVRQQLARAAWLEAAPARGGRAYPLRAEGAGGYEEHRRRLQEATRRFWSARWASESLSAYGAELADEGDAGLGFFARLRVLGQLSATYLVCEATREGELVLVDQNAARERVTFEQLRLAASAGPVPSQRLLVPTTLQLEPPLDAAVDAHLAALRELGFEIELFGRASWVVRGVPAELRGAEPGALLRDVLDELAASAEPAAAEGRTGASRAAGERLEAVLARMAGHGAPRAGRQLEEPEMLALLASLDRVDFKASCPLGRPVFWRVTRPELEQRFGRG